MTASPKRSSQSSCAMQISFNYRNVGVACMATFFLFLTYKLFGSPNLTWTSEISIDLKDLISYSILAAKRGGYAVRKIHEEQQSFALKGDPNMPKRDGVVTQADLTSNALIQHTLSRFIGIKIVSEEKEKIPWPDAEKYLLNAFNVWTEYKDSLEEISTRKAKLSEISVWVDPLDATQEYTESLTEYVTVMICIVVAGRPVFGVIHQPFLNQTVWSVVDQHLVNPVAPKIAKESKKHRLSSPSIIVSRSHSGKVDAAAKTVFGQETKVESAGGAGYKSLRVLNGTADMYLHVTSIKKWDICAGQALIEAASGLMTTLDGDVLSYFPQETVRNERGLLVTRQNHFEYLKKMKEAGIEQFLHK